MHREFKIPHESLENCHYFSGSGKEKDRSGDASIALIQSRVTIGQRETMASTGFAVTFEAFVTRALTSSAQSIETRSSFDSARALSSEIADVPRDDGQTLRGS